MAAVRVQLLGPPRVHVGSATVDLGRDMRFQALVYLAIAADWVGRDQVAFLLWPDWPDVTARHNLRQLVKRLRRLAWLPDAGVDIEPTRMRWSVASDVRAFESAVRNGNLDEALTVYRGPLLNGWTSLASPDLDDWLTHEREHLHGLWRDTVFSRGRSLASQGRHADAATVYEGLVRADWLDEDALRAYLAALIASGHEASARDAYRRFKGRLEDELGMAPASETADLVAWGEHGARPVISPKSEGVTDAVPASRYPSSAARSTSFVGREVDVAEIAHLLANPGCRLLTLTGPGGVGKSRIAVHASEDLASRYDGGVAFTGFEAVSDTGRIARLIAQAMGIEGSTGADELMTLTRGIGDRHVLLVLDNLEHLVGGGRMAETVSTLLAECRNLDVLATSREPIGLVEEWVRPVAGLGVPPTADAVPFDDLVRYDAVRLFIERADQVSRHTFGPGEARALARVCRAVDGLPLGLEIAAALTRALTVEELADELEHGLDLLATEGVNVPVRQRSIRATFEYSWSLLVPTERETLARLAVFSGGFDREAAAVVADADVAVILALIDKSLLRSLAGGRYDRHPLIHQFTFEKLASERDAFAVQRARHARYFLSVVERSTAELSGANQVRWMDRLDAERENLAAALRWCGESGETSMGVRMTAALGRFWEMRGYWREARETSARWLEIARDELVTVHGARLLSAYGRIAHAQGDVAVARAAHERALATFRKLGDRHGEATAIHNLGRVAWLQGDHARSLDLHRTAEEIMRAVGDRVAEAYVVDGLAILARERRDLQTARDLHEQSRRTLEEVGDVRGSAVSNNNLGLVLEELGDLNAAADAFHAGLATAKRLGDRGGIARLLHNIARILRRQGDLDGAERLARESARLRYELGGLVGLANSLQALAQISFLRGDVERAVTLWGATEAVHGRTGVTITSELYPRRTAYLESARDALGDEPYGQALRRGTVMSPERATSFALEEPAPAVDVRTQPS